MTFNKIALTAAALMTAGTMATANSYIVANEGIDAFDTVLELDTVLAATDGMVQILDADGALVGMASVSAGANSDVRIQLQPGIHEDLTAALVLSGQTVATDNINVDRF